MSAHWIINDSVFGKIKDLPIEGDTIKQFIDDVILKHPNWNILLKNLSDIYVWVAWFDSQKYLKTGEKSWQDIMTPEQYAILKKNKELVIAYMVVEEKNYRIHYINFFDTVVRHHNLGDLMINKYEDERENKVTLIPKNIIPSSAKYWAKIFLFDVFDESGAIDKSGIDAFIESNNINRDDIFWDYLYALEYDEDDEHQEHDEDGEED
jgi:hypothetical protein